MAASLNPAILTYFPATNTASSTQAPRGYGIFDDVRVLMPKNFDLEVSDIKAQCHAVLGSF